MKKSMLQLVLLIALSAGFVLLATRVFMTRFESGDLYPKYSSFRADPFGSKVLLKTFTQLGGLMVDVATDPVLFEKESDGEGRVVFVLGLPVWNRYLPFGANETLNRLADDGATVVVAAAVSPSGLDTREEESDADTDEAKAENEGFGGEGTGEALASIDVETWMNNQSLGFHTIEDESLKRLEPGERIRASSATSQLREPLEINQPIGLEFREGGEWRALYEFEGNVVAAERKIGQGRLILFADSYPFSNEGILNSANYELLAWIIKGEDRVTFYESHLGVETYYGLIALARLYGFDAALILFAIASAAFVWRGSFSALPKEDSVEGERGLIDIDAVDLGLNGLLVRSVDRKSLGSAIFNRWKRSLSRQRLSRQKEEKVVEALQAYKASEMKPEDLTRFYNATVAILEVKGTRQTK